LLFIINHNTRFTLSLFSDNNISQCSVATHLYGVVGLQICQWIYQCQNFDNRLVFGEVMGNSIQCLVFLLAFNGCMVRDANPTVD